MSSRGPGGSPGWWPVVLLGRKSLGLRACWFPGAVGLLARWSVGPLMLQVLGAGFPSGLVGRGAELQVGPGACCPLGPWGR